MVELQEKKIHCMLPKQRYIKKRKTGKMRFEIYYSSIANPVEFLDKKER